MAHNWADTVGPCTACAGFLNKALMTEQLRAFGADPAYQHTKNLPDCVLQCLGC